MNRIEATFERLAKEEKKAFIPYITAGDPDIGTSADIVKTLIDAGADIVEIGIPFSDPMADGPTIQKAIHRSLSGGCSVKDVFAMVRDVRKTSRTPIVFMTYYNIVFHYGIDRFVGEAVRSGADGVIVPDLPMEESGALSRASRDRGFCLVMLTAPTTPGDRFRKIARMSRGFIYYVSLTGVTGERKELSRALESKVRKLRGYTDKPVCVGFGVSTPSQARSVARVSSGVIVGSAIIKKIEENLGNKKKMLKEVYGFAASISSAVHGRKR